MALPPPSPSLVIHAEEDTNEIRLTWPILGGEKRRKLAVGAMSIYTTAALLVVYERLTSSRAAISHPMTIYVVGVCSLVALNAGLKIVRLSVASGDAQLTLTRETVSYEPGGGRILGRMQRAKVLGIEGEDGVVGIRLDTQTAPSLASFIRRLLFCAPRILHIGPPGVAESMWLMQVLKLWRSGKLFGPL